MELHSEIESYRKVLAFRTPENQIATVIVMRGKSSVWLTFDGAEKTTVVMESQESNRQHPRRTGIAQYVRSRSTS